MALSGLVLVLDIILGSLGVYLLKAYFSPRKTPAPLPPGPKGLPLVGNVTDLPTEGKEWLHWAKHKELYGPLSYISVFGQGIVILNDPKIAFDLLEKKSTTYSDRPSMVFCGEMVGWEHSLAMLQYGEQFRSYRKRMHQVIGSKNAVSRYHQLEEVETRRFLARVADSPERLMQHIRTTAGAIILKISHGYTIEPAKRDPLVDLADEALVEFSLSAIPGAWLVDSLPFLKNLPDWVPGTAFKRIGARWNKNVMELVNRPHEFVKRQMAAGIAVPSYTSELLEHVADAEEEHIVKWSAASMYSGGADTTVSAIYSFFLAMLLHPRVQKKAQAELDAVVGQDRLPTFADRPNLPYVDALVKETLRWNPVAPMGLPHRVADDDIYGGYFIPKGTLILANIYQFTHDPAVFKDPMTYNPERFLGTNPEMDSHNLSFGFGRRICPGKELADASIFLSIAMSLSVFNINKAKTSEGIDIEPVYDYTSGIISHPKEYKCTITPRSEKAFTLIKSIDEEFPFQESDAPKL